ncbi:hypothetical protein PLUTO_00380 [Luteibacter phage vB_LflM-Pluto]|uniref:Uncharacterized protein n=1 Tax=Luteibacter phage vB_LflM-Pluto TaxID=2948611 RepID=A0A9E7MUK2_9CAUD|nr:hypothetical protein PLUTO_00380 [Luteibacter phage vB_LflM-Pluto]
MIRRSVPLAVLFLSAAAVDAAPTTRPEDLGTIVQRCQVAGSVAYAAVSERNAGADEAKVVMDVGWMHDQGAHIVYEVFHDTRFATARPEEALWSVTHDCIEAQK